MVRLTSELVASLVDKVSGPAGKVSSALRAAGKQAAAIQRATAAGIGGRFNADLVKMGASASQIDRVTRAFEKYRRAAGLAGDATKWTQDQTRQVKNWERSQIAALKAVNAARGGIHGHMPGGQGAAGLSAGQGALAGAAAASRFGAGANPALLAAAVGVGAAGLGIRKVTREALSFEKVMYEVEKATDSSGEASKRYGDAILDMATKTGKTKEELGGILAAAGFAGRPKDELLRFTSYAAKATGAWGTTAADTGQALSELGNIYQASQSRIEEIGDAINTVADASASKETDLLDFLRRVGAQSKMLGISAEQTLAYGASLKEVGVQSEVAATGFNALLTKLATGTEDDDWNANLKKLGINTKDFTKTLKKDAPAAIGILLASINKIGDGTKKLSVLKDLFGQEYADDIARLAGNLAGVDRLLGLVGNKTSYLGSVDKSFKLLTEKDYNRLERANQQIDRLATKIGGPLKVAIGAASESFADLLDRIYNHDPNAPAPDVRKKFNRGANLLFRNTESAEEYYRQEEARQEKKQRDKIDARLFDYENQIAAKEKLVEQRSNQTRGAGKTRQDAILAPLRSEIEGLRRERNALSASLAARDRTNVALIENDAQRARLNTRVKGFGDYYGDRPSPLAPNSSRSFGFGPYGTHNQPVPMQAPFPPPRPGSLPRAVKPAPVLKSFDDIYAPQVETEALDEAKKKAEEARAGLDALNTTATPTVNLANVQELKRELLEIDGLMTRIGAKAGGIRTAVASASSVPSQQPGRGRSDVATATANLSRSRETNNQDRSYV